METSDSSEKQKLREILNQNRISDLILKEYKLHPQARLIDYYKLFFQDTFGPGHIITNKESAAKFLREELKANTLFEEFDAQNIGCLNNYYRVNIAIIKRQIIDFDDFLQLFLQSVPVEKQIIYGEWLNYWKGVKAQIEELQIPVQNSGSIRLEQIIQSRIIASHSKIYKKNYCPHYRLINGVLLEKLDIFTILKIA